MTPVDARVVQLVEELRGDWRGVTENLARAQQSNPAESPQHGAYVALALDHAYQAFETFLIRLERGSGLPERTGATWHSALLSEASTPLGTLRPALLPRDSLRDWEGLLRFRHFLRHAYSAELDPVELQGNVNRLARAVAATEPGVLAVLGMLNATVVG